MQGTRSALYANNRESITVTVQEVNPRSVGALIALYERAVGIYASLVNINAYHQPGIWCLLFLLLGPLGETINESLILRLCMHFCEYFTLGVEAGKKAAGEVLALQKRVLAVLNEARSVYVIIYYYSSFEYCYLDFILHCREE